MRKVLFVVIAALVVAPNAFASPNPNASDRAAAQRDCRILRSPAPAGMGVELFRQTYGTNRNARNAFGVCVTRMARVEHANRHQAVSECRTERGTTPASRAAFLELYGSFGGCVASKRRAESAEDRQTLVNAAQTCDAERGSTPESRTAFQLEYGRNAQDRSAFGRCVSQHARAQNDS